MKFIFLHKFDQNRQSKGDGIYVARQNIQAISQSDTQPVFTRLQMAGGIVIEVFETPDEVARACETVRGD